jgi:hypothetical protein
MGMKFRVLRGNHAEGSYPAGHPWAGRSIIYDIGEIVDSNTNLARFNSNGPLGPKFQRIYDATPATDKVKQGAAVAKRISDEALADDGNGPHGAAPQLPPDGLDGMTLAELKKLAKEEGISLSSGVTQEEAVQIIRGSAVEA